MAGYVVHILSYDFYWPLILCDYMYCAINMHYWTGAPEFNRRAWLAGMTSWAIWDISWLGQSRLASSSG